MQGMQRLPADAAAELLVQVVIAVLLLQLTVRTSNKTFGGNSIEHRLTPDDTNQSQIGAVCVWMQPSTSKHIVLLGAVAYDQTTLLISGRTTQ
jgi:hypothetical protein